MTDEQTRRKRPDASMTLITAVMERPLDPGYEAAARDKAAGTRRPTGTAQKVGTFLLAVVIGLGFVMATQQLRTPAPATTNARDLMVEQIRERSALGEELRAQNAEINEEINELQNELLGEQADDLEDQTGVETAAGTIAVQGPGLVVTLEDSDRAAAGEADTEEERVQDFDLQVVVNGLWASGAEAVAVNGHRLTNLTAIRSAGAAILVDLEPLVSPYRIEAIGDPDQMRAEFARSSASSHLQALSSAFSISSSLSVAEELHLRASSNTRLNYARPSE